MKIERKDLKNRVYEDKKCVSFVYELREDEDVVPRMELEFAKLQTAPTSIITTWQMRVVEISRVGDISKSIVQIYSFDIDILNREAPLEFVARAGIKQLYEELEEEVYRKSLIKSALAERLFDLD